MAYYEIPNESGNVLSGLVLNGDSMTIKDCGEALEITLNDGRINVNDGGYASKTTVTSGGYMRVSRGANASETIVDYLGSMWVGKNGSAGSTTVTSSGIMWIGGKATDVLVTSGGSMEVAGDGMVDHATVNSYGYIKLDDGATGNNVSVGVGGYLAVDSQATATIVEDGGYVSVFGGGTPVFLFHTFSDLVISNDFATVHSGTTAFRATVSDNGLLEIYGGYASGTLLDKEGCIYLSGGIASDTTINGLGSLGIDAGTAKGVTVNQGAVIVGGGTVTGLTLGEEGAVVLHVNTLNGACVSGTATDGTDFLLSDGKISNLNLTNYGILYLTAGGVADNLTVEYGTVFVSNGGTMANATFVGRTSGGVARLYDGGTVDGVSFESGTELNVSGGTAKNVSALGGSINASGGTFQNALITSGGTMTMAGESVASRTVLSNGLVTGSSDDGSETWSWVEGGTLSIGNGAYAKDTTVWDSASFQVTNNGQASDTFLKSGGTMVLSSGGTASCVFVSSGAVFRIESGGSVSELRVSEGGRVHMQITSNTHLAGTYAGTPFEVNNVLTSPVGAGFQYEILSGGLVEAESFVLNKNEAIDLGDGGTVKTNLSVNSGGTATFYSGKATVKVTENGGAVFFKNNDSNLKISFAANTIDDLELMSGDCATVHSNTVANRTMISGVPDPNPNKSDAWSEMIVYQGGIVNDTEVFEYGQLYVSGNNGVASAFRTTVHSGGSFYLCQSAIASDTVVSDGGAFDVGYKTSAFNNTVKETGSMAIWGYGVASTTLVTSGGSMTVNNGGNAFDTTVESGAAVTVDSSGTVSNTIVESTGTLHVASGGSASEITIRKGGRLAASGGILAGDVTFDDGGQLYFDLNGLDPGTEILVRNLCELEGNPDYQIAIAPDTQALGDYTFASGAEGFAGTMTVVDAELGTAFGTLTVGESLKIRDDLYCMLTLSGENLTLTVSDSQVTRDDGPDDGWNKDPYDKKKKTLDNAVWEFNMNYLYAGMTSPAVLLDRPHSVIVEDELGREWNNFVGNGTNREGVVRVDEYDFALITLDRAAKVSFTITATDKAKVSIYSLVATGTNSEGEVMYTRKTLLTTALKWDKDAKVYTVDTKSLLLERTLDGSGYFISVQSTNANTRTNPGSAYYNVEVNYKEVKGKEQTHYYSDGDTNLNDWLCNKAGEQNNRVVSTFAPVNVDYLTTKPIQVDDEGISYTCTDLQKKDTVFTNFVGFGDASDYRRITLSNPTLLSLTVTATDKAKVVISRLDYNESKKKYTEKKLLTATLKLDKATGLYKIDTAACKLPANNPDGTTGVYYLSVQSTNAKTGGSAYYNVVVNQAASTFYVDSDDGTNGWLYNKKIDAANYNTNLKSKDIVSGANPISLETDDTFEVVLNVDGEEVTFNNFVGFGDEYDYAELKLTSTGTLTFTVDAASVCSVKNASQNLKFTVCSLTKVVKGGKVTWTQKSLASGTIMVDKYFGYVEGAQLVKAVSIKKTTSDDVKYFVSVQSVGAKNGAEVFYNVRATFTPEASEGAALTMPETDELSLTDNLSFGNYDTDALAGATASPLAELDAVSAWQNLALA